MTVEYTDPDGVTHARETDAPVSGQTVSGYGGAVPTRTMILYRGRWRRVYAMAYGNGSTLYVREGGRDLVLDAQTAELVSAV